MCVFVCELSFRVRNYNCNRSLLLKLHFRYNFRASVVIYLWNSVFQLYLSTFHLQFSLHFDDCMNTTCRVTAAVFVCVLCRVSRASFPPFASASSRSPRCSRASLVAFVWLACSSSWGWLAVSPMPANAGFVFHCSFSIHNDYSWIQPLWLHLYRFG